MRKFIALGAEEIDYGVDQKFLRIIYQKFRNKALVHDNLFEGFSWPCRREELKFVGQIYDENENTPSDHIVALKYTIRYRQNMNTLARLMEQNRLTPLEMQNDTLSSDKSSSNST